MSAPVLYLVVPCYNEQEVLTNTAEKLAHKLTQLIDAGKISERSRIAFVNDGSSDCTWEIIRAYTERSALFSGINLAHNEGHQNALLAGLMTVLPYADVTISMDADLQDDINAVDAMLEKYAAGVNIVYGVRAELRYIFQTLYGGELLPCDAGARRQHRVQPRGFSPDGPAGAHGARRVSGGESLPARYRAHDRTYARCRLLRPQRETCGCIEVPVAAHGVVRMGGRNLALCAPHPPHRADGHVHLLHQRADAAILSVRRSSAGRASSFRSGSSAD